MESDTPVRGMDIELGSTWPLAVSILISLCCIFYVWELAKSYRRRPKLDLDLDGIEGFVNPEGGTGID